jgi:uncharacterized protein
MIAAAVKDLTLRVLIVSLLFPVLTLGQIPDPKPDTYVNDHARSLTEEEIHQLNIQLYQLEKETSIQLAILLVQNLPADMSIEDYAREVGNRWKVGKAHDGMVYVAALNEHKQRLEIARNLEGRIPDMTAAEIIDNLRPYLRQEDYYGALVSLIAQTRNKLGVGPKVPFDTSRYDPRLSEPGGLPWGQDVNDAPPSIDPGKAAFEKAKAKYDHYAHVAAWLIVAGLIGFCIWAWRYKRKYLREHTVNGIYFGAGSSYFASTYGDSFSDSSDSSSGFGGFGGDAGGGFDGGGASGSW